jgi:seryl-tRNA(Sec) selenium transferase
VLELMHVQHRVREMVLCVDRQQQAALVCWHRCVHQIRRVRRQSAVADAAELRRDVERRRLRIAEHAGSRFSVRVAYVHLRPNISQSIDEKYTVKYSTYFSKKTRRHVAICTLCSHRDRSIIRLSARTHRFPLEIDFAQLFDVARHRLVGEHNETVTGRKI